MDETKSLVSDCSLLETPLIFSGVSAQMCKHAFLLGLGSNSYEVLCLCFKKKDESKKKTIAWITFCLEKQESELSHNLGLG